MNAIQKNAHENSLLDLLKLIFVFFVVAVHCTPIHTPFGAAVSHILHAGVPVFFLISGYLFRSTDGSVKDDHVWRRVLRLIKLTIIWMAIYLAVSTIVVYLERRTVSGALSLHQWVELVFSPQSILKFFIFQFIPGIGYHLWYMPAQILGYLALWGIHKLRLSKIRLPLALGLLALQMFLQLIQNRCVIFQTTELIRNVWVTAIPLLLLGDWLRDHESIADRLSTPVLAIALAIGLLLPPFEFWWPSSVEFYLGNYITAVAAVLLAIKLGRGYVRPWGRWMRDASLEIYLWHILFVHSLNILFNYKLHLPPIFQWFIAPLSFGLSLGVFELQRRWKAARK